MVWFTCDGDFSLTIESLKTLIIVDKNKIYSLHSFLTFSSILKNLFVFIYILSWNLRWIQKSTLTWTCQTPQKMIFSLIFFNKLHLLSNHLHTFFLGPWKHILSLLCKFTVKINVTDTLSNTHFLIGLNHSGSHTLEICST